MRLASLLAVLALASPSLAQNTWYVDARVPGPGTGTQTDPFASIQFGIDQPTTLGGDTLLVAFGNYVEAIDFAGKAITVEGVPDATGLGNPKLRWDQGTVVTFASGEGPGSILRGVQVFDGQGTLIAGELIGGGILIRAASPVLEEVTVRRSGADRGGGIAIMEGSAPNFHDVIVGRSQTALAGGVWVHASSLTWTGGALRRNKTADYVAQSGTRPFGAGLAAVAGSTVDLSELFIARNGSNTGPYAGGGVYSDPFSTVRVSDSSFLLNRAPMEGGAGHGPIEYTDCTFTDNFAHDSDSAWPNAQGGGGAIFGGTALRCAFEGNGAAVFGGSAAFATLIECTILDSDFPLRMLGGGAFQSDLVDCLVQGCVGRIGGGIYGGSALRTRFVGNTVTAFGGVLPAGWGGAAAAADLDHCEFFGNVGPLGAAVWMGTLPSSVPSAGPGSMRFCTLGQNPASRPSSPGYSGHAVFAGPGAGLITHSIFESNFSGDVRAPQGATIEWSSLQEAHPGIGNFVPPDAGLVGYLSFDAHLEASSPSIDAGDPSGPTDPDGSVADIGARVFDPSYFTEPFKYCSNATSSPCQLLYSAEGTLSGSGAGGVSLTVSQFSGEATGIVMVGFDPARQFLFGSSYLCIQQPRRIPTLFHASTQGECDGVLQLSLPSTEVLGLAGEVVFFQSAIRLNGNPTFSSAYEILVGP